MAKYIDDTWLNRIGSGYSSNLIESLSKQDPSQRKVTLLDGGLAAVLGVAGCGKTGTMVNLLARSVADGQDPKRILAMTFTRNAAAEMLERLKDMGVEGVNVGTIHSVCLKFLNKHTEYLNGMVMDDGNPMPMELKKLLTDMKRSKQLPRYKINKEAIYKFICSCKARGCAHVHDNLFGLNSDLSDAMYDEANKWAPNSGVFSDTLIKIYMGLEKRRASRNMYAFDDILLWAWLALVRSADLRAQLRGSYDLVIVDEAQDSNPVQWDFACLAAGIPSSILTIKTGGRKHNKAKSNRATHYIRIRQAHLPEDLPQEERNSLYLFGDLAQSIYAFRQAEPGLMEQFSKRSSVETLQLPYNYRSTPGICSMGTAIIKGKSWHLTSDMVPRGGLADHELADTLPTIHGYAYPEEEAACAIEMMQEASKLTPGGFAECAILSRTSVALHLAEIECIRRRIPYRKMAAGSFFSSKEVRDVLGYLRVACGADTNNKWLKRIVNTPFRFISRAYIEGCETHAGMQGRALLDLLLHNTGHLNKQQTRAIEHFMSLIVDLNAIATTSELAWQDYQARLAADPAAQPADMRSLGPASMIDKMLEQTGYIDALRAEDGLGEDDSRLASIHELKRMAGMFQSPVEFLSYIDQLNAAVEASSKRGGLRKKDVTLDPCLTLSTIHRAKALEWDYVHVLDLVEGRFPHVSNADQDEELRLLYVAITRAKRKCTLSHPCGDGVPESEAEREITTDGRSSFCRLIESIRRELLKED